MARGGVAVSGIQGGVTMAKVLKVLKVLNFLGIGGRQFFVAGMAGACASLRPSFVGVCQSRGAQS